MKTANFPTIGTLDTTLPLTTDPAYQSASLSLTLHQTIKNLSDNGFVFQQAETSDFTTFGGEAQSAIDNYIDRYEDILQSGFSSVVATLPDVLPIMGALLSGGAEPVLAILLQGVLDTLLRHKDTRTDHYDSDNVDTSALVTELQALKAEIQTLHGRLQSTGAINLADILDQGLIDENASLERYSILWNLARQAIRVIVTSNLDVDDVLLDEITG